MRCVCVCLKCFFSGLIISVSLRSTSYLFVTERQTSQAGNTVRQHLSKLMFPFVFRNHEHRKLYNNNKPISLTFEKYPTEPVARARARPRTQYIIQHTILSFIFVSLGRERKKKKNACIHLFILRAYKI